MSKIALSMIVNGVKSEAPLIKNALDSVQGHVDALYITVTHKGIKKPSEDVLDVINSYRDVHVTIFEWENHFAKARNFALEQIPADTYDWVLWLDADDTVDHPEKIKDLVEAASSDVQSIILEYLYDFDDMGNVNTTHWVSRLFRNNGRVTWKGRIHETLVDVVDNTKVMSEDVAIRHHASEKRRDKSLLRNIKMLEKSMAEESSNPDPRTMFYLAGSYKDAGLFNKAKELLELYLTLSGWAEERAQAHLTLGRILIDEGSTHEAKDHFLKAIGENPLDIEPWVEIGSLELQEGRINRAVFWLESAISKVPDKSAPTRNPINETYRPYMLLADCHMQTGGKYLDIGLKLVNEALKVRNDENTRNFKKVMESLIQDRNRIKLLVSEVNLAKHDKVKIRKALKSVPNRLKNHPTWLRINKSITKPKTWGDKQVAIFTGNSALKEWGPWSLEEGIGGSEEAIIRLSKRLQEKGYKVTVYANPSHRAGVYDGVVWKNYWEVDLRDHFNIFIAWRSPYLFDLNIKAKKTYLWLHDVIEPEEISSDRLRNITKVIVLSDYHRSLFPKVPNHKILVSANGIDPEEFKNDPEVFREPHKIIYASSHERGLQHLLNIWTDVRKAVPNATLDIYYGWQSYDSVNHDNPERMAWKDTIVKQIKELDGVTDYGRVSQDKIVSEGQASAIWAYPCHFPEIYCITAVKAQASGAMPVTTNYAALEETVQFGDKLAIDFRGKEDEETYKEVLIEALQNPMEEEDRKAMVKWALENNSWESVAEQWIKEFDK